MLNVYICWIVREMYIDFQKRSVVGSRTKTESLMVQKPPALARQNREYCLTAFTCQCQSKWRSRKIIIFFSNISLSPFGMTQMYYHYMIENLNVIVKDRKFIRYTGQNQGKENYPKMPLLIQNKMLNTFKNFEIEFESFDSAQVLWLDFRFWLVKNIIVQLY